MALLWGVMQMTQNQTVTITAPLCEHSKHYWAVHFQGVNLMVYELFLKKVHL